MIPDLGLRILERAVGRSGIVTYHGVAQEPVLPDVHISVPSLAEQLSFLAANYRVIPLGEFVERKRRGHSLRGCVAVTFDDAYLGVQNLALPLLVRHQLPATVFVTSGIAADGGCYWWDQLGWIGAHGSPEVKSAVCRALDSPDVWDFERLRSAMLQRGGRNDSDLDRWYSETRRAFGEPPERPMTATELAELARCELVDFGCHSVSHPVLPLLPEAEQVREIAACYTWLAYRLPRVHPYLAYPYGLYTRTTIRAARRAGMSAGFSMDGWAAGPSFNPYWCPRIGMGEGYPVRGLRLRLAWFTIPMVILRNGSLHPGLPSPL